MGIVKNTRFRLILEKGEDMKRAKKGVINVKFTWNGVVCGVLVVGIFLGQSQEAQN